MTVFENAPSAFWLLCLIVSALILTSIVLGFLKGIVDGIAEARDEGLSGVLELKGIPERVEVVHFKATSANCISFTNARTGRHIVGVWSEWLFFPEDGDDA